MLPTSLRVLVERRDLLAAEASLVAREGITWSRRLHELGPYERPGGRSSGDRRRVVEAMAAIEREAAA